MSANSTSSNPTNSTPAAARRPLHLLLVEDNPGDVLLLEEALAESPYETHLHVVGDGESAIACLRGTGDHAECHRPDVMLLDLRLPGRSGGSVLAEIKDDENLRSVPVVILTSSDVEADVRHAYNHHCNTYVVKPEEFGDYDAIIRTIEDYWGVAAHLPAS